MEISNSLIVGNQAGGGSTPGNGGGISLAQNASLSNVTFAANSGSATSGGGGLWLGTAAAVAVNNCILWQNTTVGGTTEAQQFGGFNPGDSVNYSCIQGLSGGLGGLGNIGADPLFANAAGGDYRLSAGSPCIDAADNSAVPAGILADVFGNPRFVDDPATADTGVGTPPIVDMGAAEFGQCVGDTDGDRDVDLADLSALLSQFGLSGPDLSGDLDGDDDVDLGDLTALLSHFGLMCP